MIYLKASQAFISSEASGESVVNTKNRSDIGEKISREVNETSLIYISVHCARDCGSGPLNCLNAKDFFLNFTLYRRYE